MPFVLPTPTFCEQGLSYAKTSNGQDASLTTGKACDQNIFAGLEQQVERQTDIAVSEKLQQLLQGAFPQDQDAVGENGFDIGAKQIKQVERNHAEQ